MDRLSKPNFINQKPNTLLIVKTDAIGDYMLFRNLLKYIRESKEFRNYKITLCGNEIWKDIALTYDRQYIDKYIWLNKNQFVLNLNYRKRILSEIQEGGFEIAVNPIRSRYLEIDDAIIRASKAVMRIGREGDLSNIPILFQFFSKICYNKTYRESKSEIFEYTTNKYFVESWLNLKVDENIPSLNIPQINPKKHIVIVPGSGEKVKQWKPKNFATLCSYLNQHSKKEIIMLGSSSDKVIANEIIRECSGFGIINLCGKTSLPQMAELIANAEFLISNDTGAGHIAASVKTPTICLINGIHFGRFGPYPKEANWMNFLYPSEIQTSIENKFNQYISDFKYSTPYNVNMISVNEVINCIKILEHRN